MSPKARDPGLLLSFLSPCGAYELVFEDDGKVAYAYLKKAAVIVGDVWLYNRCQTPSEPEWSDRARIPFALSRRFITKGGRVTRLLRRADVRVDWEYVDEKPLAYVYVFCDLYGVLGEGDKPGYARFAAAESRLARVMVFTGSQE